MGTQATKVVFDTNVFVSGLLWQGKIGELFDLVRNGVIAVCISRDILAEFERVLAYPKFVSQLAAIHKTPQEVIDDFLEIAEYYVAEKLPTTVIFNDPSDDMFLACALTAGARFIISGDKHLISLKYFHGVSILSPAQFLKIFRQHEKAKKIQGY